MNQSIKRCLDLLKLLAVSRNPLSFSEIDNCLGGINSATLTRLLQQLTEEGYIKKSSDNRKYEIGPEMEVFGSLLNSKRQKLINTCGRAMKFLSLKFNITMILLERMDNLLVNILRTQTETSPYMQEVGTVNILLNEPWNLTLSAFDSELEERHTPEQKEIIATIKEKKYLYDNQRKAKNFYRLSFPLINEEGILTGILGAGWTGNQLTENELKKLVSYIPLNINEFPTNLENIWS